MTKIKKALKTNQMVRVWLSKIYGPIEILICIKKERSNLLKIRKA